MSEIMIRRGLLEDIGELLREAKCRGKAAVVSDETVAVLYLDRTKKALERAGFKVCAYAVPAGEASKSVACPIAAMTSIRRNPHVRLAFAGRKVSVAAMSATSSPVASVIA